MRRAQERRRPKRKVYSTEAVGKARVLTNEETLTLLAQAEYKKFREGKEFQTILKVMKKITGDYMAAVEEEKEKAKKIVKDLKKAWEREKKQIEAEEEKRKRAEKAEERAAEREKKEAEKRKRALERERKKLEKAAADKAKAANHATRNSGKGKGKGVKPKAVTRESDSDDGQGLEYVPELGEETSMLVDEGMSIFVGVV